MTTLISRSPITLCLTWLLLAGTGLSPVWAQDTLAIQDDPREPAVRPAGDIIYLKDENGRPFPVPLNVTLKEYLEWRESQSEKPENQLPEYSVNQLTRQQGDNEWLHFDDTVYGGDFLQHQPLVNEMTQWAPKIIDLMDRLGVTFNRTPEGFRDQRRKACAALLIETL